MPSVRISGALGFEVDTSRIQIQIGLLGLLSLIALLKEASDF
jgi:hypothetical protein